MLKEIERVRKRKNKRTFCYYIIFLLKIWSKELRRFDGIDEIPQVSFKIHQPKSFISKAPPINHIKSLNFRPQIIKFCSDLELVKSKCEKNKQLAVKYL